MIFILFPLKCLDYFSPHTYHASITINKYLKRTEFEPISQTSPTSEPNRTRSRRIFSRLYLPSSVNTIFRPTATVHFPHFWFSLRSVSCSLIKSHSIVLKYFILRYTSRILAPPIQLSQLVIRSSKGEKYLHVHIYCI